MSLLSFTSLASAQDVKVLIIGSNNDTTYGDQGRSKVLHSEKLANTIIKPAEHPKSNREWTVFSESVKPPENKGKARGKKKTK